LDASSNNAYSVLSVTLVALSSAARN